MLETTFYQLTEKEVINCNDCTRLGFVCDCTIDLNCARIIAIIVEPIQRIPLPFKKGQGIIIPWECIRKIGDDIILVDNPSPLLSPPSKKRV